MGVFVSTVSADVPLPKLGIILVHPTVDYDLGAQFSGDDLKRADDLTTAITSGTLIWKRTAGGATETAANYDPDYLDIHNESSGGFELYRSPKFNDLLYTMNETVATTTSGTKTLTATSRVTQFITGTAVSFSMKLPSALVVPLARTFDIWNLSTQDVSIRDDGSNLLAVLKPNGRTLAVLQLAPNANGTWRLTYTLDNGNVFGAQLFYEDDDAETSNNSNTTWVNKITLVTPALPLGDYIVQYQFNWRAANADRVLEFRVQRAAADFDGGSPFTGSTQDRQLLSGFKRIQSISGVQTFELDFRRGSSNTTVYMYNARLFVWRVA